MVFLIYLYLMFCVMDLDFTLWEQKDKKDTGFRTFFWISFRCSKLTVKYYLTEKENVMSLGLKKKYFDPLSLVLIYMLYISGHKK